MTEGNKPKKVLSTDDLLKRYNAQTPAKPVNAGKGLDPWGSELVDIDQLLGVAPQSRPVGEFKKTALPQSDEDLFQAWMAGEQDNDEYDYRGFYQSERAGGSLKPTINDYVKEDPNYHFYSIGVDGKVLKSPKHKTFDKTIAAEKALGNELYTDENGDLRTRKAQPPQGEQDDWINANREEWEAEWADKNIFEKIGTGIERGGKQLKGGMQKFGAEIMPKIGAIGERMSGGAYTADDIIDAMTPMRQKGEQKLDEAGAIQGKGLAFEFGTFIPQMAGTFAALAAAPFSGGTSASAIPGILGTANIGALTSSVVGSTLYEVEKYSEETGKEISEAKKWSVALLAGTAEFAAEKIRLDRFLPKGMTSKILTRTMKESPEVAESMMQQWAKARPAMYQKLLQLGKTTFRNSKEEGIEELWTQIAQDYANYLYQDPEDRMGFQQIMLNALNAAKGGAMMGGFIGPASYGSSQLTTNMMRKRKGGVSLVQTSDGKVYEALGQSKDGEIYVQNAVGKQSTISKKNVKDQVTLTNEQMKEYLDAYDQGSAALPELEARIANDPETQIRELGKKYTFLGYSEQEPQTNSIRFGELRDGRMVILTSVNEAENEDQMVYTAKDAENPEAAPFMVKGNDVINRKSVSYEEWVANELAQYQATKQQMDAMVTKAQAPVQEGETIPIGERLFNVTEVTDQGITLNEIDKDGNLTATTEVITPDKYGEVFGMPEDQGGQEGGQAGGQVEVAAQPAAEGGIQTDENQPQTGPVAATDQGIQTPQAQPEAIKSRKISDGSTEFTIMPEEDGSFRMQEVFDTQKKAESTLKKLTERYPKLTWEMQMVDSGDPFTPDEYVIKAAVKQAKKEAPAAPAEAPAPVAAPTIAETAQVEVEIEQKPTESEQKSEVVAQETPVEVQAEAPAQEEVEAQPAETVEVTPEEKAQTDLMRANREANTRPTEAQKEAGNYKKGHMKFAGFDISIENPVGSVRSGTDPSGKKWSMLLNNSYGYFRRTKAKDGDQVDVFLGDNLAAPDVYIVDQVNPETGTFDEHKVMMGFNSAEDARDNYLANYEPGWKGMGSISKMSLEGFKKWLGSGTRTRKPVDSNVPVKAKEEPKEAEYPNPEIPLEETLPNGRVVYNQEGDNDLQVVDTYKRVDAFRKKHNTIALWQAKTGDVVQDIFTGEVFTLSKKASGGISKLISDDGVEKNINNSDPLFIKIEKPTKQPKAKKAPEPAEDTRPVKQLTKKKGWPMSKVDIARLSREPQSFEEAVYQFFINRGRISTARLKHHLGTRSRSDYASFIWAHKKDGQMTDKLNEAHIFQSHPELLTQVGDQQDQERAFFDILLSVTGLNDMRTRIDEMQSKADHATEDMPPPPDEDAETAALDTGQVITEEILPLVEGDPDILRIFEVEINELGKTLEDLKALAASDPNYFQTFPYGLNEKQFNELKSILNDTERQKQISGLADQVGNIESRSQGNDTLPGVPVTESRDDGEGREEGVQPTASAEPAEVAKAPEFAGEQFNIPEETPEPKTQSEFAGDFIKKLPGDFLKASDGSIDFGYIKPETGLKEAPIRLTVGNDSHGLIHIDNQHGEQIKKAGYRTIQDFVEEVAKNYSVIRSGSTYNNKPTYLLELTDDKNRTLIVEMSKNGEYWNVNSAGIFRKEYSKNKEVVWSLPALGIKQSVTTDEVAYPSDGKSGADKVSGNSPQITSSEAKDTKKIDESQESQEKKTAEFAGEIFDKPEETAEIIKLREENTAANEIIEKRIQRLRAERDAKEESLQKRNELFGDRKEEEEKAEGMQPMFAGDIFKPTSENLQTALKPFNDGIKKAEEEIARNNQILDEKIALVLSGAQMTIDMEAPAEPGEKAETPKEDEPDALKLEMVESVKPSGKIEDFGEKISGAKKEIRGQIKKHLDTTNEDILNNSISKTLPPIDYKQLIDSGAATREEAAFLQYFRHEIGPKPKSTYKQQRWLRGVNAYKDVLRWITDKETFKAEHKGMTFMELMNDNMNDYAVQQMKEQVSLLLDLGFPEITSLKGYELRHFEARKTLNKDRQLVDMPAVFAITKGNMIVHKFDTREEAIAGLKYILTTDSEAPQKVKFDMWRERNKPGIFIGKKLAAGKFITLAQGFDKVSEASAYVKNHQEELERLLEEKKVIPYERPEERGPRVGKDYRGGDNITPEVFSETFGFRGVQFGNYVEQLRRQEDLNEAYDALVDLADVIGVPPRALSLSGQLGVAFGARGSGGKNAAAAHYEPHEIVINLTKGNGPGSFAHEWFHAVDSYFSRARGRKMEFITDRPRPLIKQDGSTDESIRPEVLEAFDGLVKAINQSKLPLRSRELDKRRSKDYWSTTIEMGARSFESYVRTRMADKETKNDYLVAFRDMVDYIVAAGGAEDAYPYPTEAELGPIGEAFDKLFQTISTKEEDGRTVMFRVIGERGATLNDVLIDNLATAKKMEPDHSPRAVFLATGWQRGADGLWRYETRDIELKKDIDFIGELKPQNEAFTEEIPLTEIVDDEELFNSYPQLKNVKLTFYNYGSYPELTNTGAFANFTQKIIAIGTKDMANVHKSQSTLLSRNSRSNTNDEAVDLFVYDRDSLRSVLSHELQHYIQRIEGFGEGGTLPGRGSVGQGDSKYQYSRLVGEVEARNVQRRLGSTPEVRRQTMLSETEDVARDQQIIIRNKYDNQENRGIVPKTPQPTGWNALSDLLEEDDRLDREAEVKTRINQLAKSLNTDVVIVQNRAALPTSLQGAAKRVGLWDFSTLYGIWDPNTDTMYVMMDDLMKSGPQNAIIEATKTVLHEAIAHKGLPAMLGTEEYIKLLDDIYDSIPKADRTTLENDYNTEDKRTIAHEYLGMMAEDNVNPNLFQRILAKIRELIRKFYKVDYTANDIHSLLRQSRKNLERGPEGQSGYYRSRPVAMDFEYAGEFMEASQASLRARKAAAANEPQFAGQYFGSPLETAAKAYAEKKAERTGKEVVQGIREYIQDMSLPIRRFEEEVLRRGGKQDNNSKPYRDMSLSFGRQEKLYNDYYEQKMKPVLESVAAIKRSGMPGEEVLPYIIAKHAMERNPIFRGRELREWTDAQDGNVSLDEIDQKKEQLKDKDYSGVMGFDTTGTFTNPDQLAAVIVSEFEGKIDKKLINDLWDNVRTATSSILDTWEKGNQISAAQKQEYLDQFRYFVPLRGWRDGAAKELVYTRGDGFSASLQHAQGRKSLADNPLAYLLNVEFQAIGEQVDNEVKNSMLNLILRNLGNNEIHDLATIKKLYYVKITLPDGTEEWEPTIIRPSQDLFDSGAARTKIFREHERLRKPSHAREHEVVVSKPGGDMVIVFNGKQLSTAQAMNRQNYMYRTIFGNVYDARDLNKVMALMGHLNNMLKALYTSWNVVFPFTNFMRDFQEASITQSIKSRTGLKVVSGYRQAFPAILRRIRGKQDLTNPIDQQLEDFYNYGGATGYTHMKTPDEIEKDINSEIGRMTRKGTVIGGIGDAGHTMLEAVESWNKIFEDATRFSVYLSSLSIGKSKEDAAYDAKEASVNFNTKGKGSKAWDAWLAFWNVAVQSLQKNFKLAKDSPKRFTQVAMSFVMLGFLEALMNAMTDDDDPDNSYYNLNPYMRQNYLVIPLPNLRDGGKGNKYISIPLPQFWRGFKSAGTIAFDVATGKMKAKEAVASAIGNFAGGLLPVDIGGFYKSGEFSFAPIVPTIFKPGVELMENRNYMGYTIKKEPFTREQEKYLADAGLGKDNVNPGIKFFTDLLFRWGGGDTKYKYYTDRQGRTRKVFLDINPSSVEHLFKGYAGGTGGVFSDLITTISQVLDPGEEVSFKNTPFINKFLRETPEHKWRIISEYYSQKEQLSKEQTVFKEYMKQAEEGQDYTKAARISNDEYTQTLWSVFDNYEDQIKDLNKDKTKDDTETTDLIIELMDMCLQDVDQIKRKYNKK